MTFTKSERQVARDLAHRIHERRTRNGWTQQEAADRACLHLSTYVRFERTGRIAVLHLLKVLQAYGLLKEYDRIARAGRNEAIGAFSQTSRKG